MQDILCYICKSKMNYIKNLISPTLNGECEEYRCPKCGEVIYQKLRKEEYQMDIKIKLKERLLEIPINHSACREKHRLAKDINVELKDIEPLLDEMVEKKILKEKFKYRCPSCNDPTIMDDELLKEIMNDDDGECFPCDKCIDFIYPAKNKTEDVFYDIKDRQALKEL